MARNGSDLKLTMDSLPTTLLPPQRRFGAYGSNLR
jgi:hypothetical protein